MTDSEILARAREVFDIEARGLAATRDSLDGNFVAAVKMIASAAAENSELPALSSVAHLI